MEYKPKLWIAITLGIIFQFLGMLYVQRLKLAIVYFILSITISASELYLYKNYQIDWLDYFSFNLLLTIICIFHCYYIIKNGDFTKDRPFYSRWYGLVSIFLLIIAPIFLTRTFLFEPFQLPSTSMSPTYEVGDYIVVNKFGCGNYEYFGLVIMKKELSSDCAPKRSEVYVFKNPSSPNVNFVKRIVGLPGDTIELKNKRLFINDKRIERKKISDNSQFLILTESIDGNLYKIKYSKNRHMFTTGKWVVPKGAYFSIGDNRDQSSDSRHFGVVPESHIIGKVIYLFNKI